MKGCLKLVGTLFIGITILSSSTAVFGQSSVVAIGGNPPTRITDAQTGELVGAGYLAALYWAPLGENNADNFLQVGASQTVVNGTFPSGTRTLPVAAGETVQLYGAAWEAAFGNSYQQAAQVIGAKVGRSTIVQGTTTSPSVPVAGAIRIPDFSVSPVPEPSSVALLALGAGALLWRRWRR